MTIFKKKSEPKHEEATKPTEPKPTPNGRGPQKRGDPTMPNFETAPIGERLDAPIVIGPPPSAPVMIGDRRIFDADGRELDANGRRLDMPTVSP